MSAIDPHAGGGPVSDYEEFLAKKLVLAQPTGFDPPTIHEGLFPHQKDLARWALRRGRAAVFASTGLGKSRVEAEFARRVHEHTGKPVLILAPLAVAPQTVEEGASIGVPITLCRDGADVTEGVNVTNYDRLHRFDTSRFAGVVLDESSVIKHENSKTLAALLEAFRDTPFKLSATATPAPNDYTELGTQAEFLGVCTRTEMLSEYFVHDGGDTQTWRLKGHARGAFWRWVASWAALVRTPSDLGYDDGGYSLPPLHVAHHVAPADQAEVFATGRLFVEEAGDLTDRRLARKASMGKRVAMCVEKVLAEPDERWIVWVDLNAEQDAIAKALGPECVSVYGSLDADEKEKRLFAFLRGEGRILLSKPSIAGWGINVQSVARMAFVGVTDSFEAYFQAVRRCWRFRQTRPVYVHIFASEAEGSVIANLQRKERDATRMAEELSAETRDVVRAEVRGATARLASPHDVRSFPLPAWLNRRAS